MTVNQCITSKSYLNKDALTVRQIYDKLIPGNKKNTFMKLGADEHNFGSELSIACDIQ